MQHWCRVGGWRGGGRRPKSSNRLQSCTPFQTLSAGGSPTGRGDSFNDRSWKRSDELATTSAHEEVLPGLAAQSSEVRSTFVGLCALSRQWHQRHWRRRGKEGGQKGWIVLVPQRHVTGSSRSGQKSFLKPKTTTDFAAFGSLWAAFGVSSVQSSE